jgi:hypothetical protein
MPTHPSLAAMNFASDAVGARFAKVNGRFILFADKGSRGITYISAVEDREVWF